MERAERIGLALVLSLPGVLTVYFAFNSGGFFPAQPAIGAVFLALVLVVRVTTAERPFTGLGWRAGVAMGALWLYALWTLVSMGWSHAPGRALVEFDRALLYALALTLFASIARTPQRLGWILRGVALGIAVVCIAGLVTRILPELWSAGPNIANNRLSFPVSYWNTLGLLASLGIVLCLRLSSSRGEPLAVRAAASGLLPVLALTLYFTFSRAAIAAGLIGVVAYLVLARSRTSLLALAAATPPVAVAVVVAYHAAELATFHPASPLGISQGHRVALVGLACAVVAALVRLGLSRLDPHLLAARLPAPARRARWPLAAAVVVAALAIGLAVGLPHALSRQYDRFITGSSPTRRGDLRTRLSDVANNGRTQVWKAAFASFREQPFHGQGAGTYQLAWELRRPYPSHVKDAHGLYFEVPGELGVVGLVLLLVCLLSLLVGSLRGYRRERGLAAVLFALFFMWTLRAGVDWDWEMPVVSLWVFALGGAVLAGREREQDAAGGPPTNPVRVVVALVWLLATAVPVLVAVSEGRVDRGVAAFDHRDCRAARSKALSSLTVLSDQARAYELIGYCDLRDGYPRAAIRAMQAAVAKDPGNWQYRYDVAAARASAGLDPRAAVAAARGRNPREDLTDTFTSARGAGPRQWVREGRQAMTGLIDSGLVGIY